MDEVAEVAGDEAPAGIELEEGAAPDSLSYAELEAALAGEKPETTEKQAEEIVPDKKADTPEKKPETVAIPVEEYEKLKKKIENQELFLQRQGTEVGQLRKLREQLLTLAKEKRALAEEQLITEPGKALDTHAEAREAEQQANQYSMQEAFEANRAAILQQFPNYEERVNEIAEAAIEMGVPDEFIANYKRDPYATPVGILIPYVRAAALRKHYFEKAALADKMKAQLEELSKSQGSLTAKIKEAANSAPVIKSSGGAQTEGKLGSVDEYQIPDLSDAELERLLKVK